MNGKVVEMKPVATEELPAAATVENMENGDPVAEFDTDLKYMGWKAMPYVIGNETCEKLGTIGTSSNLLVYLTRIFHMKSVHAATLLNVFNGTTNLAPVFGAFLADTYLGRYATLGFASVSSLTGMLILTLTAGISKLHPPECSEHQTCLGPSTLQLGVLYTAFAFLVVGAGGIRSCNLAFGADQFNPDTESGRRGINSFFNWYYFTFTFAMMVSATVVIYIQSSVSWSLGLAIPTVIMFFSCAFFFLGTWIYVRVKPKGSPLGGVVQVLVAAFRNRNLEYPDHDPKLSLFNPSKTNTTNMRLSHTDQFRFLDKASIIVSTDQVKPDGLPSNPWRLCSLQQVEEVKCIARIIPVWFACMIYYIATAQHSNYVVLQALQSDRHLGNKGFQIPAGSFTIFSMLALTIWIPIYDRIIVPRLRRITGKEEGITLLQRMSIGLVISVVAITVAGLVEERRKRDAHMNPNGSNISSMSSLWLIPQLVLFGFGEVFTVIGQIEFYYKQFPENMKSIAGSMFFLGAACSNYLSGLMVTIVHQTTGGKGKENWLADDLNKGKLDYFYFLIATIAVVNFMYFIVCARWYRYKGFNVEPEIALEASKSKSPPV